MDDAFVHGDGQGAIEPPVAGQNVQSMPAPNGILDDYLADVILPHELEGAFVHGDGQGAIEPPVAGQNVQSMSSVFRIYTTLTLHSSSE